jgi:hypothetical protein
MVAATATAILIDIDFLSAFAIQAPRLGAFNSAQTLQRGLPTQF